jgi:hypothetical protein
LEVVHALLRLHRLRDARPSIVVLPADTTTELKAESEIVLTAADVFVGARSSGAEQRSGRRNDLAAGQAEAPWTPDRPAAPPVILLHVHDTYDFDLFCLPCSPCCF